MFDPQIDMNFPNVTITAAYEDGTEKAIVEACNELAQTLIMKRRDYGKGNIAKYGSLGIIVRADDKLSRLHNLTEKLDVGPTYEPVIDSWADLAGYALIGKLFSQGKW